MGAGLPSGLVYFANFNMFKQVILKPGKEKSLNRYHLWVFSGAIQSKVSDIEDGDWVVVLSSDRSYIASGHFQNGSIMVRILSFRPTDFDTAFWIRKLEKALEARKSIGLVNHPQTNVYRLIHGEGDHCPGLVVDFYNGHVVIQTHSAGMYKQVIQIAEAVQSVYGSKLNSIYLRNESQPKNKQPLSEQNRLLYGVLEQTEVLENGYRFQVDIPGGQKTGFFIDQRDNRNLLKSYCFNKSVMNLFGYTGGFSVYALGGGASKVHTVDVSAKAVEQSVKNAEINEFGDKHQGISEDAFSFFNHLPTDYDIMVLDPPAFAKHQGALSNAREAYRRLNKLALDSIKPGGLIFTFSCSQVVSRDMFRSAVFTAAAQSKRKVRILHQLTQPADHPVNLFHPETEYLKGLVLYVD